MCWRFARSWERRRKETADLIRDREDVASRGIPGGGEAETSPEARAAWLAATIPVEVRLKNLGWGCGGHQSVVVAGVGEDRWI
jgi:hypothetical protein